jgi:hypothetical protein
VKRGTPDHWKMKALARELNVPPMYAIAWANGVMERIWHYTAKYCPQGDLGRVPDEEIAEVCGWPAKAARRLVDALVTSRWLERSSTHRLIVHDWHEHCDESVKKTIRNRGLSFLSELSTTDVRGFTQPSTTDVRQSDASGSTSTSKTGTHLQKTNLLDRKGLLENFPESSGMIRENSGLPLPLPEPSQSRAEPDARSPRAAPQPISPAENSAPPDTERRIRSLAESQPDPQDFDRGINRAVQEVAGSGNPAATLTAMEENLPAWWDAMRDGRAKVKPLSYVIADRDYIRRPREPSTHRKSAKEAVWDRV